MLKKLFYDEEAQGMTEYILIIGLVAVICVAVLKLFGNDIKSLFQKSKDKIAGETGEVGR